MTLSHIIILCGVGLGTRLLRSLSARRWVMLLSSIVAIYWLQPLMPIRNMDYWLPTMTLALVVWCWVVAASPETRFDRENILTLFALTLIPIFIALTRYIDLDGFITASKPPETGSVLLMIIALAGFGLGVYKTKNHKIWLWIFIFLTIMILIIIKLPAANEWVGGLLRGVVGQSVGGGGENPIRWLGYSYLAFRLIHTLREHQSGSLKAVSLQEYVLYVLFFPTLTAGPIDRLPRFTKDLRATSNPSSQDLIGAGQRVVVGLFKKFVLADGLSLIALNNTNATQVQVEGWYWVLLYAYALQLYFDFSGYTDIAIGLGKFMGIHLPENFNHPYVKPNLTQFWNNWHMTLTQWFRAYFFNPVTRSLRKSSIKFPLEGVIFFTQVSTMVLIGLWHGISLNFVIWGLWHGVGLFFQNRWSEWVKPKITFLDTRPRLKKAVGMMNIFLTFNYVAVGWVWFMLDKPAVSWLVLKGLLGV
jgi:alginate O-acetyltransferase complex protein AlgI